MPLAPNHALRPDWLRIGVTLVREGRPAGLPQRRWMTGRGGRAASFANAGWPSAAEP